MDAYVKSLDISSQYKTENPT